MEEVKHHHLFQLHQQQASDGMHCPNNTGKNGVFGDPDQGLRCQEGQSWDKSCCGISKKHSSPWLRAQAQ